MKSKKFSLGTLVTITTGKFVCTLDDLYVALNYLTGDNICTHQIPRVMRQVTPHLYNQYPFLRDIPHEEITPTNWREVLSSLEEKYGDTHVVYPIHKEDHVHIDAYEEIVSIKGEENVFKFELGEGE